MTADSFASLAARIEADLRRVREDVHVFGGSLVLPGSRLAGTFEALSNLDAALAEMKERAERMEEALREIRDLPTQHDLLFNAEAKALHYIAAAVLAETEKEKTA